MRKKQLEKAFIEYMETISEQDKQQLSVLAGQKSCIIFGTDELHYNPKRNTLYIKPLQMLMEQVQSNVAPQWCALVFEVHEGQQVKEAQAVVGTQNPYESQPEDICLKIQTRSFVYAVPYEFGRRITQMVEQQGVQV